MIDYREEIAHGNSKFPIAIYRISPEHIRYQMTYHWHPEHEICYVRKGKLKLTLDNETFDATAGDIFFIQGGTLHAAVASDNCEYDCFVFDLNGMIPDEYLGSDLCKALAENRIIADKYLGSGNDRLMRICRDVTDAETRDPAAVGLMVTGLLLEFVGVIAGEGRYKTVSQPTDKTVKSLAAMRNILRKIEEEYMNPLTLEELAREANLSTNYFCRFFKKLTSRSPIDYLIAYRVGVAEYMLGTTDRQITDIALACGFNDVSHFIKYFRREKGITPGQYRLAHGKKK